MGDEGAEWGIETTNDYDKMVKRFRKKQKAVVEELELDIHECLEHLRAGCDILQLVDGKKIRNEHEGLYAFGRKQPEGLTMRLYFCVEEDELVLLMLNAGDKKSQKKDINLCHDFLRSEKKLKGDQDETNR